MQISTECAKITGPAFASPDVLICESIDKQTCIKAPRNVSQTL